MSVYIVSPVASIAWMQISPITTGQESIMEEREHPPVRQEINHKQLNVQWLSNLTKLFTSPMPNTPPWIYSKIVKGLEKFPTGWLEGLSLLWHMYIHNASMYLDSL